MSLIQAVLAILGERLAHHGLISVETD